MTCGARLIPLTSAPAPEKPQPVAPPIKGLSLPARESPGELPPELQKLEAELSEPDGKKDTTPWLDTLRTAPMAEESTPTAEEAEVPDWLNSVQPAPPSQTVNAKAEPEIEPATEIPAWLQRIRPAAVPEESAEIQNVPADQVPDWLKTVAPAEQTPIEKETKPVVATEAPGEKEQTPVAAKEEPVAQETQPSAAPQEPAEHKEELAASTTETPPAAETPAPTPVAEEEIPTWLRQFKPKEIESPTTGTIEPEKAEPLIESIEDQVAADLKTESPVFPRALPSPIFSTTSDDDIPDWLRTAPSAPTTAPSGQPSPIFAGTESAPTIQPALPEEVPDWLASLKPAEQLVEEDTIESSGPLAGLHGVLPLALAVTEPHPTQKRAPAVVKSDSGQLFESILAAPQFEATPPAAASKRRILTMRPLIYLLIALAAVIPFFIPSDWAGSVINITSPLVTNFYDTVQALPANSTVLMSFDYDPSQSSEMDLQAKAIVQHLIARRVKIMAMSTLATGAPIAQNILDDSAHKATNYTYGTSYLNLGYRAGYEAGLAQLATGGFQATAKDFSQNQALSTFTAFANVRSLRDVALVIELAGSEDPLRMWMEQVQPSASVKIVAGVSASVEPKARAYYDTPTKQLAAVVSGLVGAAQYEVLTNRPGVALASLNAQSFSQMALVLIILLGNIVFWISRGQRRNV